MSVANKQRSIVIDNSQAIEEDESEVVVTYTKISKLQVQPTLFFTLIHINELNKGIWHITTRH